MRFSAWLFLFAFPLAAQSVDFSRQVHPILVARCASCHNGDRGQAGLSVMTREAMLKGGMGGAALVPGKADASPLVRRLKGLDGQRMPLAGAALADAEIALIERWVNEGAVVNAGATPVRNFSNFSLALRPPAAGGIDELLKTYDQRHQVAPVAPVPDYVFARRAYLDLWGLLPTPADQDRFAHDSRDRKSVV